MTDAGRGRRVALLSRPGAAEDQLREALVAAGANCVLQADPTQLDLSVLLGADAQVVLVALDPMTEETLQQFDEALSDPRVDVIYEDAELAATREDWDAARWQRHLVAKLQGHRNVLPDERTSASSASLATQAAGSAAATDPDQTLPATTADGTAADADAADITLAIDPGQTTQATPSAEAAEAAEAPQPTGVPERADSGEADTTTESSAAVASTFGELTLDDGDPGVASAPASSDSDFRHEMDDLEERASTLELVDHVLERPISGAVLLLAGLGGPDAVRQLLGALPVDFGRPVLVQQRLDGGRYDKLVAQMQRASAMPVSLAKPGQRVLAGIVYILPAAVGITVDHAALQFDDSGNDVLGALPAGDSAVLMLSGSDPDRVDAAMNHSWSGALVAGQAVDGCYDAAAARALATRGCDTGTPAELAAQLVKRWPATESDKP